MSGEAAVVTLMVLLGGLLIARTGVTEVLDALYYRLDLYGADERPSNSKVLTFMSLVVALAILARWAWFATTLDGNFVFALLGVLAVAGGKEGFKHYVSVQKPTATTSTLRTEEKP